MNMLMFPRMLASHDEGWAWLMEIHPRVVKMFALYVVPMSLLPAVMLVYAADVFNGDEMLLHNISNHDARILAVLLFIVQLAMVPLMGAVMQRIGDMVGARPAYHDAFAFAAVVPTPLWLSSLALAVPSAPINALASLAGLFLSVLLIYEGTERVFRVEDPAKWRLLAGSILTAGLVAWAALMGLGFAAWRWAIG